MRRRRGRGRAWSCRIPGGGARRTRGGFPGRRREAARCKARRTRRFRRVQPPSGDCKAIGGGAQMQRPRCPSGLRPDSPMASPAGVGRAAFRVSVPKHSRFLPVRDSHRRHFGGPRGLAA
ncbi:hypothetical protein EMIT0111MI5_10936 [Burkholderia sp. IT-111MI5]